MEGLEDLVHKMESQMDRADSKLDTLSMRLDQFEIKMIPSYSYEGNPSEQKDTTNKAEEKQLNDDDSATENRANDDDDDDDDDGVDPKLLSELLFEVRRVRTEYDQLHMEVQHVQELQQEVTRSVRKQMKQVQSHFDRLRERIIGSTGGGSLPTNK